MKKSMHNETESKHTKQEGNITKQTILSKQNKKR